MSVLGTGLLAVSVLAAGLIVGRPWLPPVERAVTRLAMVVSQSVPDRPDRRRLLGAAAVPVSYRQYAATTRVLSVLAGILGALAGVSLAAILATGPLAEWFGGSPTTVEYVLVQVAGGGALASGAFLSTRFWRWQRLRNRSIARQQAIDAALPHTVAVLYALTRGGTSITEAMRTIGDHRDIYGAAADEIDVAVREMTLFGSDMVTATQRMAYRSPSDRFRTFGENLASVLQSGRNLSEFFREQYNQFREGASERETALVDRLATIAEVYVTVLVAGVLFMLTILIVVGLTIADVLTLVQAVVYLVIPLLNAGMIVYLDQSLQAVGFAERRPDRDGSTVRGSAAGGVESRVRIGDRLRTMRAWLARPRETLVERPARSLYVTVPLASLLVVVTVSSLELTALPVRRLDDLIVQASLLLAVPYAVARVANRRRIRRIEGAVPDLMDRLASLNEAGMSLVESIGRVTESDLGALGPEVAALDRDVRLGATLPVALDRFQRRVGTTTVARVVTLITYAHRASGSVGPVLRIAAADVRSTLRLRRTRRQEMLTYLVVIYIAFAVFVLVALVLRVVLLPSLPDLETAGGDALQGSGGLLGQIETVDRAAFALVLSHAVLIQAVCSGLVAGQIGEGRLADGVKHAAIMVAIGALVLALVTGPVATLTTADRAGSTVSVDSVTLSDGGYLVVRAGGPDGSIVGRSAYLSAGTHRGVSIDLESTPDGPIRVSAYRDADGDRQFQSETDAPYPDGPGRESVAIQT